MWTLVSSLPFILFYCVRGLIRISTDYTQVGPASPWKMCNSTNNRTENVDFLRSVKINSRKCDSRAVFGSDLYLLGSEKQYFSFLSPVPPSVGLMAEPDPLSQKLVFRSIGYDALTHQILNSLPHSCLPKRLLKDSFTGYVIEILCLAKILRQQVWRQTQKSIL